MFRNYKLIFLLFPYFAHGVITDAKEIHRMAMQAKEMLTGNAIDVYHEYSFTGKSDGSSEEIIQWTTLYNDKNALQNADIKIPYNSTYETIEVLSGRVLQPDGEIVKIGKESTRRESYLELLELKIYSDQMLLIITPPSLKPGSIVDVVVKRKEKHYLMKNEFWGDFYPQRNHGLWSWTATFRAPVNKHFIIKSFNIEEQPTEIIHSKMREIEYSGGPNKEIKYEVLMPPITNILPRIAFSTIYSFDEMGKWYYNEIKSKANQSKGITMTVASLTLGTDDEYQQIKKICGFVRDMIRYVGLEFGETSIIPTDASDVLACRYGDCKDKSILLISMLKTIGIDAYFVLLSGFENGPEITDIPLFDQFSHAIVYIPKYNLWVDPTNPFMSIGQIGYNYQGRNAFVMSDTCAKWLKIPADPSEKNSTDSYLKIDIDAKGNATINGRDTNKGLMASAIRATYALVPENLRETMIKSVVSAKLPGAENISVKYIDIDSIDKPVICSTYATCENFAKKTKGLMIIDLPIDNTSYDIKSFLDSREKDIYLPYSGEYSSDIEITFPNEYAFTEKPYDESISTSFAQYRVQLSCSKNKIKISSYYKITDRAISKDQFADYKKLMESRDDSNRNRIILTRK